MTDKDTTELHIVLMGDRSDLQFLRDRAVGVVEDLCDEYAANLDDQVAVDAVWEEDV